MCYADARVAVVVPAYNEAPSLARVVTTMPAFVDDIIVVDDGSTDDTPRMLAALHEPRLRVVSHPNNRGVGAAIASGYGEALARGARAIAVMGGDGQMDPDELESLVRPIVERHADYVKGNRFASGAAFSAMPIERFLGNLALSFLSRPLTGYWDLIDSQCGYTCISARMLKRLPLDSLYPRYGVPNDILSHLGLLGARIQQRPVTPIYTRRRSHMNMCAVPFTLSALLLRLGIRRMRGRMDARSAVNTREAADVSQ